MCDTVYGYSDSCDWSWEMAKKVPFQCCRSSKMYYFDYILDGKVVKYNFLRNRQFVVYTFYKTTVNDKVYRFYYFSWNTRKKARIKINNTGPLHT